MEINEHDLLEEQRRFYRARAPEYDEWWQRAGPYDRGDDHTVEWQRQVATVEAALASFGATGDVLELAGGTGWWTERLSRTADHLTVVDTSPEAIALNRARVDRRDVRYVIADVFTYQPDRAYDVVFFSFWLSHVPRSRFGPFWSLVRSCLAPGGRVFLVDNHNDPTPDTGAHNTGAHGTGTHGTGAGDPYVVRYGPDLHLRRLRDGSQYHVVKVMYEPDELQALLVAEGWSAAIDATRWFVFGSAQPG